jgi:hypothetical protein
VPAVLAEQLLALVAEQCAVRPTILVIGDLQWADQASVTLWGRPARSAGQMPLLLVGMVRPCLSGTTCWICAGLRTMPPGSI